MQTGRNRSSQPAERLCHHSQRGFTLVELLVVIGIIALLISILLPALNRARQLAQRTACMAKIKTIVLAAQLHASDHQGYYPLAGVVPGWRPGDLDDAYSTKYDYYPSSPPSIQYPFLAPITFALSLEMSRRHVLDHSENSYLGPEETDSQGVIRNFLCPSQGSSIDMYLQYPSLYISGFDGLNAVAYNEAESYMFNEAILGWADPQTSGRLRGKVSLVRQPGLTMFAADGLMGDFTSEERFPWQDGNAMISLYNISTNPPVTMADAFRGTGNPGDVAGDNCDFDLLRHQGKVNVGFCDGHVETRSITVKDLTPLFLLAP